MFIKIIVSCFLLLNNWIPTVLEKAYSKLKWEQTSEDINIKMQDMNVAGKKEDKDLKYICYEKEKRDTECFIFYKNKLVTHFISFLESTSKKMTDVEYLNYYNSLVKQESKLLGESPTMVKMQPEGLSISDWVPKMRNGEMVWIHMWIYKEANATIFLIMHGDSGILRFSKQISNKTFLEEIEGRND